MIYKSYLVEENPNILKNNIVLFYGENHGLILDFKKKIRSEKKKLIINLSQNEILDNKKILFKEINNLSLFEEKKIIFIQDASDKILEVIEEILPIIEENKIFMFANLLDKKSRLRSFCEKDKKIDIVPCYQDTEISLKKIIFKNLENQSELTNETINILINACSNDRAKLKNEINKIKTYFNKNPINNKILLELLNTKEDDDFNNIKDAAFNGKTFRTNELLSSTNLLTEKLTFYVNVLNNRLVRLDEIKKSKDKNIENAISKLKPPIFWKDKPNFLTQIKIWDRRKINLALNRTYSVETLIKSNSTINKKIIFKKLLVEICNIANAA